MAQVGDRVEVRSGGQPPRVGVIVKATGTLITVRWDTGGETMLAPAPGAMTVLGRGRGAPAAKKKAAPKKAPAKKTAPPTKKKAAPKKAPAKKKAAPAKKKATSKKAPPKKVAKAPAKKKAAPAKKKATSKKAPPKKVAKALAKKPKKGRR